ncbi:N-acyl-L-amino acid amidohydrolase [Niabella ginsenosidivorans]|uniref:N-acyl-L-amino acid amidohydrolase n=1 Tax=Niabella ginsenosidivorans TaxID=1176587 RepID=A0A1A9HY05_9BACT|nr:M20 family metallopeptidase [Niabella ginsenosidivorans]ANH80133.1 N-acyl-L-amino acid amidohydrolase [Niabella ginsenosidivorans]
MDNLKSLIKEAAFSVKEWVLANRRHLHQHPELSFREWNTCAFIKTQLDALGVNWEPVADTGVIAVIKGEHPSEKVIALRADIDALPITEENTVQYRSCNEGVMHACGHDVHTASLLGVARILQFLRKEFAGTVKLIFQPGEEMLPGGASKIIAAGGLKNPDVQAVLGQHVMPAIPAGKIGVRLGLFMASMDEIKIEVTGKGGHGAEPHKCIDPVMITCTLLQALQQLVSRNADPLMPSVLSFGKLRADGAINIIPDKVLIEGTFRTLNEGWRDEAHKKIKELATALVAGMGGECLVEIRKGYPHLKNNEAFGDAITGYLGEYAGRENIVPLEVWMAAEDFAYYAQELPAFFYLLGVGNAAKNLTSSLHTATFNIDEAVLELSCGGMSYAALRWLGNQ